MLDGFDVDHIADAEVVWGLVVNALRTGPMAVERNPGQQDQRIGRFSRSSRDLYFRISGDRQT
jgi:hypothetical protein